MKKLIVLLLVVATGFSCGPSKTVQQSRKVLKGYWNLDNISYDRAGTYKVTLLNDATADCFEGSTWRFIPNNNTGNYTINNPNCSTGERNFRFSIAEVDANSDLYDFMLKPTDAKGKSDDNSGVRIRLAQLDDSSMRWEQTVSMDGSPFTITMSFSKIQD